MNMSDADDFVEPTIALVASWLVRASESETRSDRAKSGRLRKVMADPGSVGFTMSFVDRVARPDSHAVAAQQLHGLVARRGLPSFLSPLDKVMLSAGAFLAPKLPRIVMPLTQQRMRQMVGHLVADSDLDALKKHLQESRDDGYRVNVNLLGEAVLGHGEADRRLAATEAMIADPEIDYVSVKLSSIAAQLEPWAFDEECERLRGRLRGLFAGAMASTPPTFINLDMEEYRDLALTIAVFTSILDEPEFLGLTAGLVLQAYLPDSYEALQHLVEWANRRRSAGGAEIKVRLVKGANLSMERVDAAIHGWEEAPFRSKADTDANYKRCLDWVMRPDRVEGVRIGVASHNLFDVAFAHLLAESRGVSDRVEFEMLQGMSPAQSRVVKADAGGVLLYTPAVAPKDFDVAISYLVRRLEENASPENFLHSLFDLAPGSAAFVREESRFRDAMERRELVPRTPFRTQTRLVALTTSDPSAVFVNEPDTDPRLAANREWAKAAVSGDCSAPSTPLTIELSGIDQAVEIATGAFTGWSSLPGTVRREALLKVADKLSEHRGVFVSAMVHEASKTVGQADPEISEAIDFARYYADRAVELDPGEGGTFTPAGVVVVVPPWNFPVAIPTGGVMAALAAGNSVILKPAPETPRCAELIAEACWAAGIPTDVLQFVRCPDNEVGQRLVTHPDVAAVILTGALETADLFRSWKPELNLLAETSGKNALVITSNADIDLAVADLVASAFGHSGQKCSAASLAICVGPVYESERFRRQLKDAVESIRVGPANELSTNMNPLVAPAIGKLLRALTTLEQGEEWLVEPKRLDEAGQMWSPGVRLGVVQGSWFHKTECFGPVLGVMRARDLDEALAIQNATSFGLTGGIHTLEPAEVDYWLDRVEIGNAYVNRGITGAIVQRQPFGGWKQSAIGPGAKAGGPNYVLRLGDWSDASERSDAWLARAKASDERWWRDEFSVDHDPTGLFCESNVFRYRPLPEMVLRVGHGANEVEVQRCVHAAQQAGVPMVLSRVDEISDASFGATFGGAERVRCLGTVPTELRKAAAQSGVELLTMPVVANGRIELLNYVREQAISRTLHRFGNVLPEAN